MELDNLCLDLIERILSFIPLKPRTRLKVVSRTWHDAITTIRSRIPQITSHGILVLGMNDENRFLDLKDHGQECDLQNALRVRVKNLSGYSLLINSCNGLLVYADYSRHGFYKNFIIFNPITSQQVTISAPHDKFSPHSSAYALFDDMKQTLKLICYETYNNGTRFHVFLSETWEWRTNILPSLIYEKNAKIRRWCDYYNQLDGKLYTMTENFSSLRMLIYDREKNLVERFKIQSGFRFPNILWGSEGVLYTCRCDNQGFDIFSFSNLDLKLSNDDGIGPNAKCRFEQRVPLSPMKRLLAEKKQEENLGNVIWCPSTVTFSEDLQTFYLQSRYSLCAYSLETQKFSIVTVDLWPAERIEDPTFSRTVIPFKLTHVDPSRIKRD
ncbi:hypothetical protein ACFE04_002742 [Oxalis oulophora]